MNSNFDLNINNYTIKELEELFELPSNYDESIIEIQETKLRQNIISDRSIVTLTKNNTLDFINKVKKTLTENLKKNLTSNTNVAKLAKNWENIYNINKTLERSDLVNAGSTNIIKREVTPYGQSSPSEFYQGTINPLNKRILRQNINIDTRFRENYYSTKSTNIMFTLPFRLEKVISYRIVGITLPLSYYNISQSYGNNVIQINVFNRAPPGQLLVSYSLILPDGCYNTTQNNSQYSSCLEHVINNMLINDVNSPNNNALTSGLNLRYTIDRTSGRSIFAQDATISGTVAYNFEVIMSVENSLQSGQVEEDYNRILMMKLGWILGFRFAKYSSSNTIGTPPTTFGSIVSEGICFTKFPMYGFLAIDDFNSNANDYYISVFSNSVSVANIVAKVNLTKFSELVGDFQGAQGESSSTAINREKRFFGPVNIQKLKVTLYDDMGRVLDLNNMDWSLELAFECVYNM